MSISHLGKRYNWSSEGLEKLRQPKSEEMKSKLSISMLGKQNRKGTGKVVSKTCPFCGKEFSGPKWYIESRNYCSKSCASTAIPRGFEKGYTPWNKGLKGVQIPSDETRKKMGLAHLGLKYNMTEEGSKTISESTQKTLKDHPEIHRKGGLGAIKTWFKNGHKPYRLIKGKSYEELYGKRTEEIKLKLRKSHIGLSSGMKGKTLSFEAIEKIRNARMKQVIPEQDTTIEIIIQDELNKRTVPFKTHVPIGFYQVDILLSDKEIIECYGCYWHACSLCEFDNLEIKEYDSKRVQYLQSLGYTVHILWEHEIRDKNLLSQKLEGILK